MDDLNQFGGNPAEKSNDITDPLMGSADDMAPIMPDTYTEPEGYGADPLPDPAASPESYGETSVPDPAAAPESYGETSIPDPAAAPESYGETSVPDPAAAPESYGQSVIPTQVTPQNEQPAEDFAGDRYSWNGREYVQTGDGNTVNPAPQPNVYAAPVPPPPAYNQNVYQNAYQNQTGLDPNLESRANSVKVLGVISVILSIICCGCSFISPILSIIGLVKASGMSTVIPMMSDTAKKKLSSGKKLCIAGIVITIVLMILSFVFTIMFPALIGYMEKAESSVYY